MENIYTFFWQKIEDDLVTTIPNHLKNILHFCGFKDAITVKNIDDDEFEYIENTVRTKFITFLNNNSFFNIEPKNFFGIYESEPENFEFSRGEIKLMKEVASHVKRIVDADGIINSGIKYFYLKKPPKKKIKLNDIVYCPEMAGYLFASKETCETTQQMQFLGMSQPMDDQINTLRSQLYKRFLEFLKSYTNLDPELISKLHEGLVNVCINENKQILGSVTCFICCKENTGQDTGRQINVFYKNARYWIMGNFGKHLKNVHKWEKQVQTKSEHQDDCISNNNENSDGNDANIVTENKTNLSKSDKSTLDVAFISESAKETKHVDSEDEILNSEKFDQLIEIVNCEDEPKLSLGIIEKEVDDTIQLSPQNENYNLEGSVQYDENSTADFKRYIEELLYSQISDQNLKMSVEVIQTQENEIDLVCTIQETECILKATPIRGDGDCMFRAILHQLKLETGDKLVATLRKEVVSYIEENYEDFENELFIYVCDRKSKTKSKKIANVKKECTNYLKLLSKKGTWGGTETIKAVTKIYGVNILVFDEKGYCYFPLGFNTIYERTILLAYRLAHKGSNLRNHYDSITQIDQIDILKCAKNIAQKIANKDEPIIIND